MDGGGIDNRLGEAVGDQRAAKKGVTSSMSFTDAIEGLVELADETSVNGGRSVIALGLFCVDVRDDVGIEEGTHDVHLPNLEIVMTC